MRAETIQKWTHEIQSETLVSLHSYAKRSQQLPSTPRGTVEILVSPWYKIWMVVDGKNYSPIKCRHDLYLKIQNPNSDENRK